MIAAAAGEITFAKQLAKRRILAFAHIVASWAEWGWRINDPQLVDYKGNTNSIFDDVSKKRFESSFESLGLDFAGKPGTYFWMMARKMGKYYRLWNAFVQECAESEDAFATAMTFIADALFRAGHSLDENGLPMKDFLYFIGENAVVEFRKTWAATGRGVTYYTHDQELKLKLKRNGKNRS